MSCNHLHDCARCGGIVDDLEDRVCLLSNGLSSALGYINTITAEGWVSAPSGFIDALTSILKANGHVGPLALVDKFRPTLHKKGE